MYTAVDSSRPVSGRALCVLIYRLVCDCVRVIKINCDSGRVSTSRDVRWSLALSNANVLCVGVPGRGGALFLSASISPVGDKLRPAAGATVAALRRALYIGTRPSSYRWTKEVERADS